MPFRWYSSWEDTFTYIIRTMAGLLLSRKEVGSFLVKLPTKPTCAHVTRFSKYFSYYRYFGSRPMQNALNEILARLVYLGLVPDPPLAVNCLIIISLK